MRYGKEITDIDVSNTGLHVINLHWKVTELSFSHMSFSVNMFSVVSMMLKDDIHVNPVMQFFI